MEPNIQPIPPSTQTSQPVVQSTSKITFGKTKYFLLAVVILLILFAVGGAYYLGKVNQKSKIDNGRAASPITSSTPTTAPTIKQPLMPEKSPLSLVKVGEFPIGETFNTLPLIALGNYVYIADAGSLNIFNITNPTKPTKFGSVQLGFTSLESSLSISGNYAYILSASQSSRLTNKTNLLVINISNPRMPTVVYKNESMDVSWGVTSGNHLYAVGKDFEIFDVSNPANPAIVGSSKDNLRNPTSIAISGNYAFVGNTISCEKGCSSLQVFDIHNPNHPISIASLEGLGVARQISISGNYAYILDDDAIDIVDITNPSNPKLISSMGSFATGLNNPQSFIVSGNYLYVPSYANASLLIYDIRDSSKPILTRTINDLYDYPSSIAISDNFAYIGFLYTLKVGIYKK